MIRAAFLILLALPAIAAAADEPNKVSNDRPDRPLQMPPASSETREAFDDFERFARRGAWERAAKALYAIPEAQAGRFVDGDKGFIIAVARKRRALLAGLSPEGQAAYRLFYDADAKKLLDTAEGPTEAATLERIVSLYLLTSVGDNAADRLGDLYYERGQFDRAADAWLAVLRERPDSEIPPAALAVKAALALARAGRTSELEAIRVEVADRFPDEVVALGGRKAKAAEHLAAIVRDRVAKAPAALNDDGPPPVPVSASWQVRFAASVTAGMTPPELAQWEGSPASAAVPPTAVEGGRLFANYLGHVFAVDLANGKMLWRSSPFHNAEVGASQNQGMGGNPKRYAVLASGNLVWSLGRDLKDANTFGAPARLVCRRAETGEVVWGSADLPDYAGIDLLGTPILAAGSLFVAGKTGASSNMGMGMMGNSGQGDGSPRQVVLSIRPRDGKVVWKAEVAILRESQGYSYYGMPDTTPQPRLAFRAGAIYLDTQNGILARLDAASGAVEWGYGYPTEPVQSQDRMVFFFNGMPSTSEATSVASPPLLAGDAIVIKGSKSDRIIAIDPDRMKVLWERPIAQSARLLGLIEGGVYLGGPDLGALDPKSRALRWSTPLPGGSEEGQFLVRPDGLWGLTPRGIFEVDPGDGRVRRIIRGDDPGAAGGNLILAGRWLLAITNKSISAYPRGAAGTTSRTGGS